MNIECDICYETKFINECGAFNNCKARVCNECKDKSSDGNYNFVSSKCVFCKTYDYKDGLMCDLISNVFDCCGELSNIYVIFLQQHKYVDLLINEEYYEELDFCLPCEERKTE